jgi:CubicO group peptidase (beta-lactamase class C family)
MKLVRIIRCLTAWVQRTDRVGALALTLLGSTGVALLAGGCGADPSNATPTGVGTATASSTESVAALDWRAYDKYLKRRAAAGAFSGAVLVAKDGRPLLKQGYGLADRKRGIANTAGTKFPIASMGKMFTAIAIAQLVEQGKLSFDDTIGKYVPGFPPKIADKVTIDQLLTHTSGMGDAALAAGPGSPRTLAGMLERIVKAPLQFEPGSRFGYSNDGFIVLGAIVERVSGQRYADYVRENVFKHAGMTNSDVRSYEPSQIANMAHGYALLGQSGRRPRDTGNIWQIGNPSGGGYSTLADLLKFARALTSYKLLGAALTDTVLTGKVEVSRPGGPPIDKYAYGFADQRLNGVRFVGHNGGTPGYEAQLDVYPDRAYVVVILTNEDQVLVPALRRSEELVTR